MISFTASRAQGRSQLFFFSIYSVPRTSNFSDVQKKTNNNNSQLNFLRITISKFCFVNKLSQETMIKSRHFVFQNKTLIYMAVITLRAVPGWSLHATAHRVGGDL